MNAIQDAFATLRPDAADLAALRQSYHSMPATPAEMKDAWEKQYLLLRRMKADPLVLIGWARSLLFHKGWNEPNVESPHFEEFVALTSGLALDGLSNEDFAQTATAFEAWITSQGC